MVQVAQLGTTTSRPLLGQDHQSDPSRAFYLRSLARLPDCANMTAVRALTTLPRHNGREGAVRFETVDLPVLIDVKPVERNALTGLPGTAGPQGPTMRMSQLNHLLS